MKDFTAGSSCLCKSCSGLNCFGMGRSSTSVVISDGACGACPGCGSLRLLVKPVLTNIPGLGNHIKTHGIFNNL